ncbi:unnamed protein product, partial [Closterium sp. NIES-65]
MLSVLRVHLPSDIPIAGCELCPYVLLRKPDGTITTEDIPDTNPIDGYYIRCRWYRVQSDKRVAVCSVHGNEPATLQCLGCVKAKLPIARSYHCSPLCFQAAWPRHRALHSRGLGGSTHGSSDGTLPGEITSGGAAVGGAGGVGGAQRRENGATAEEEELFGKFNSGNGTTGLAGAGGAQGGMGNGAPGGGYGQGEQQPGGQQQGMQGMQRPMGGGFAHRPPGGLAYQSDTTGGGSNASGGGSGEVWFEVGRGKPYTPTTDDVGHVLKLECVPIEAATGLPVAPPSTLLTSRVIPAPSPTPRRMVQSDHFEELFGPELPELNGAERPLGGVVWVRAGEAGVRSEQVFGRLLQVQSDHFEEFFGPELEKQGYASVFKKKTAEVYTGTAYAIDGCATFFRRDRFSLVKKYEVEFNKAALSLSEALAPPTKKAALNRLLKDNVALIVVLEARDAGGADGKDGANAPPAKRQLLCVANTHIHANPELKDVKLWQVHTLLKGLEKIAASADIPMLVAGDFNSVPGSAPHSLLATGRVDANHPELATDPLGILRPASKLCHQLPLVSAYASLSRGGSVAERQRRRMDASSSEPLFTNVTRDFMGTLDYTFYTADSLSVESVLELLDEDSVRKDTALPSPEWSSDHLALLTEQRTHSPPSPPPFPFSPCPHPLSSSPPPKFTDEFTDEGPSVEVRVPIPAALRPIQARHVAVSVQEDALSVAVTPPAGFGSKEGAVKGKEGRERSLVVASPLYGRVKATDSAWYIDDTDIVITLFKHPQPSSSSSAPSEPVFQAWPTLIKGWEALAGAVANQLKSCSVLLVGGSTRLNAAVAAELATGLGYAPIMTQQLVEQLASATIDEVAREEGLDSVAQAETALLDHLSSYVPSITALFRISITLQCVRHGQPCSVCAMGQPCSVCAMGQPCSVCAMGQPCSVCAMASPAVNLYVGVATVDQPQGRLCRPAAETPHISLCRPAAETPHSVSAGQQLRLRTQPAAEDSALSLCRPAAETPHSVSAGQQLRLRTQSLQASSCDLTALSLCRPAAETSALSLCRPAAETPHSVSAGQQLRLRTQPAAETPHSVSAGQQLRLRTQSLQAAAETPHSVSALSPTNKHSPPLQPSFPYSNLRVVVATMGQPLR